MRNDTGFPFVGCRTLKRVPLEFDWPLGHTWDGYAHSMEDMMNNPELVEHMPWLTSMRKDEPYCKQCNLLFNNCQESAVHCALYNKENRALWLQEPPVGDGYQCWETTSEGSPISPVFPSLNELCEWLADNATIFADIHITAEQWKNALSPQNDT